MEKREKSAAEISKEIYEMILGEHKGNKIIYICSEDDKRPEDEKELLNIFKRLNVIKKAELLVFANELENE